MPGGGGSGYVSGDPGSVTRRRFATYSLLLLSDILFGWSWVGWIAVASMKVAILSVVLVITVDPFTISIQSHPKINAECMFWIS